MDVLNMLFVGFTCIGVGYFLRLWREEYLHLQQERREAQAELEQRISTPEPGTFGKSTYWQAITLIAQVDDLIEVMDKAEQDKLIDEMQL